MLPIRVIGPITETVQVYTNKTSLDLNEIGPNSVRIRRNKLGYYSGLAVVPNDVVIALGTGASVGKAGEKKGGSRYQESVAEAEWDFYSFLEGEWICCDVGMWELHSRRPAAVRQACFCILILFPLLSMQQTVLHGLASHVMVNHPLPLFSFTPPPFIPLFMALMVLNNLYVSECTAPSVHVGRAREQLGQSGRITWFHPSLKAAGYLTSTRALYSPQSFRVRFFKEVQGQWGYQSTQRERTLYLSVYSLIIKCPRMDHQL